MNRTDAGIFAAVVAISAMVTAGFSWLPVALGWGIGTGILLLLPGRWETVPGKLSAGVVLVGGILVLTAAVLGAEDAFPEDSTFPFVSAALLLLLWRAMCGEQGTPASTANLLGLIVLPMLAVLLIFGLKDVSWTETIPNSCPWQQVVISTAVTCPWWCFRSEGMDRRSWLWYGMACVLSVGMSLLTRGILGGGLVEWEAFPLYRAVQTIRILGTLQRMEALLAATILMGAFAVMLLTGREMRWALDTLLPRCKGPWKCGAALGTVFVLESAVRLGLSGTAYLLETVFWGLVPVLALWVVFAGKNEKNEKSA